MSDKEIHVVGGGTISHVRAHLALCAPAYGNIAKHIAALCEKESSMSVILHLTKMANSDSLIEDNGDLKRLAQNLIRDKSVKIVFWSPAIVDFSGQIPGERSSKYSTRLKSQIGSPPVILEPEEKIVDLIRKERKDIFLVSFKTTCNATPQQQYTEGLNLLKRSSSNLVLANDIGTRNNMIIVPEEAAYFETNDRLACLEELVKMVLLRSHLTFTRSTVVKGEKVDWWSSLVPDNLRTIVDFCIAKGAYKKFRGVTAGHFAVRLDSTNFLTSRRKTDFNDMKNVGLVMVQTDSPDSVLAFGSKPSVGGQSQRIVFEDHPGMDCIVHFHCEILPGSKVPIVSQREFECGSHQCGKNTSSNLASFGNIKAVHLDKHGPNIVFSKDTPAREVISFIEANFDLTTKTGGYEV